MRWVNFYLWYFITGSLVFLLQADFEVPRTDAWANGYYFWDISKDVILWIAILKLKKEHVVKLASKEYRLTIVPFTIYISIRLLWATIKPFTSLDENHPKMVAIIFTAALTTLITLLLADLRKRRKEL